MLEVCFNDFPDYLNKKNNKKKADYAHVSQQSSCHNHAIQAKQMLTFHIIWFALIVEVTAVHYPTLQLKDGNFPAMLPGLSVHCLCIQSRIELLCHDGCQTIPMPTLSFSL